MLLKVAVVTVLTTVGAGLAQSQYTLGYGLGDQGLK